MKDKLAGKYQKYYQKEFDLAREILKGGVVEWSKHDYIAFTFCDENVFLVFYPHKTSAGNYHIRVRDQGSKDKNLAQRLMKTLDKKSGSNCTFSQKLGYLK